MIKILLGIQNFLKDLFLTLGTVSKILLLSGKTKLEDVHPDKDEVVILGNGPSLTAMLNEHPEFLEGKDLVCVNHFPSSDLYTRIKPKYLISSAVDLYREDIEERFLEQSDRLFRDLNDRTSWPLIFFFPFEARKYKGWQNLIKGNKYIRVCYYNKTPIEGFRWARMLFFNLKYGMARPHNVMVPCMSLMIWLGYKKVYLWGADHSWLKEISVDENNNALINQKHFYDENESRPQKLDWGGKGSRKLHEILYKFMTAFKSYFDVEEYARANGVRIINCTKGSFIDAFERKSLD